MTRRRFLATGTTLCLGAGLAACGGSGGDGAAAAAPDAGGAPAGTGGTNATIGATVVDAAGAPAGNVVLVWVRAALEAIRVAKPGPPMVARSLAIVQTAMFDAWAAYDPVAVGTQLGATLRRPAEERTMQNKAVAISHAAYVALLDQYPGSKPLFDATMKALGRAPDTVTVERSRPEGIGNLAAQAVVTFRRRDGANQDGTGTASGVPYADTTGYVPLNAPASFLQPTAKSTIAVPDRWQPISYVDETGVLVTPTFIGPHWREVRPFALTSASQFRPPPPKAAGTAAFAAQAQTVIDIEMALTEREKVIAEYWADGPHSELPPGHWCLFAEMVSVRDAHDLDRDVRMFFALSNAVLDASIAIWDAKRHYDYVRPLTAIRYLKNGQAIRGFGSAGPAGGIVTIDGAAWRTFQRERFPTPPFPEYPSGHSGFSTAAAEVLRRFTGSDRFGGSHTQAPATLQAEPLLPREPVTLSWPTFTAAAEEAGYSRLLGGIHFEDGNRFGLMLGRQVGAQAWARAQALWSGSDVPAV
ncbi:MAG: vanadium-dependent haloperoxidase [Lautropia sp.]